MYKSQFSYQHRNSVFKVCYKHTYMIFSRLLAFIYHLLLAVLTCWRWRHLSALIEVIVKDY